MDKLLVKLAVYEAGAHVALVLSPHCLLRTHEAAELLARRLRDVYSTQAVVTTFLGLPPGRHHLSPCVRLEEVQYTVSTDSGLVIVCDGETGPLPLEFKEQVLNRYQPRLLMIGYAVPDWAESLGAPPQVVRFDMPLRPSDARVRCTDLLQASAAMGTSDAVTVFLRPTDMDVDPPKRPAALKRKMGTVHGVAAAADGCSDAHMSCGMLMPDGTMHRPDPFTVRAASQIGSASLFVGALVATTTRTPTLPAGICCWVRNIALDVGSIAPATVAQWVREAASGKSVESKLRVAGVVTIQPLLKGATAEDVRVGLYVWKRYSRRWLPEEVRHGEPACTISWVLGAPLRFAHQVSVHTVLRQQLIAPVFEADSQFYLRPPAVQRRILQHTMNCGVRLGMRVDQSDHEDDQTPAVVEEAPAAAPPTSHTGVVSTDADSTYDRIQ